MSEFWLWFWRPIAELLGTFALLAAVLLIFAVILLVASAYDALRAWCKRRCRRSSDAP